MARERPETVPEGATYDGSMWNHVTREGKRTIERSWWRDGELYRVGTKERGVQLHIVDHHKNGRPSNEWIYRDGTCVIERAWYAELDDAWGYVNLRELLREWDLPSEREALRALVRSGPPARRDKGRSRRAR